MVAIDPKEADGAIPSGSNIAGEGTADFNILLDAAAFEGKGVYRYLCGETSYKPTSVPE
jgi:hypothetical protein